MQEIKGEKKYGINTTGADELKNLKRKGIDTSHATIYMPVSYSVLEDVFKLVNIAAANHFVDIGCGKGRVMCVAGCRGANKVTGIDFSEDLCRDAANNLSIIKEKNPLVSFEVINITAKNFNIPEDADCIFMFNPFDNVVMKIVIQNIKKSFDKNPRPVKVIYVNPVHKNLFINEGFTETGYLKQRKYFEVSVLLIT